MISDIGMPDRDGFELVTRLRADTAGRNAAVKAIALTAYASVDDRQRSLEAGFHAHFSKPVNVDDLLVAIEKIAGGFGFTEGPLFRADGTLWFSDVTGNVVRQWSPAGRVDEILRPGGYDANDAPAGSYIGPNGMTAGKDGAGACGV